MPAKKTKVILQLVILLMVSIPVMAQETISPDRPGLGNGSYVVNPKMTYLESGVEYFNVNNLDQFSLGQVLFRHGLVQGVELRMLLNSFVVQSFPSTTLTGVPDPGVGVKAYLYDKPFSKFRLAALGDLSIPVGSTDFTSDDWIPTIALLADYSLTEYASFSGNLGYTFEVGSFSEVWKFTLTPSYSLPGEANLGIYAGYAGFYSEGTNEHFIETGITKHLRSFLQLDINAGLDIESLGVFFGGGLALRF